MKSALPQAPIAFVTGGGRGLGWIIAQQLAAAGWSLGLIGRDGAALDEAAAGLTRSAHGVRVVGIVADVADYSDVESAVANLRDALGAPILLVNNAGVIEHDEVPIWEADAAEWHRVIQVNLLGVFNLVRAVVPLMLASGRRPLRVINVSSGAALRDSAIYSAYHASKTGLNRITTAIDLAGRDGGLLAFDISPGIVRTDMTHGMRMHHDRTEWTDPELVGRLVVEVASGRLDEWSGRHLNAGVDVEGLPRVVGPDVDARTLRLHPWGEQDPLASN